MTRASIDAEGKRMCAGMKGNVPMARYQGYFLPTTFRCQIYCCKVGDGANFQLVISISPICSAGLIVPVGASLRLAGLF